MRYSRQNSAINAGSMADIAFLLLIFFLVCSSIPNDKGIARKLPEKCPPGVDCSVPMHERNVLRIRMNEQGGLFVENELTPFSELRSLLIAFIDNNGDGSCAHCDGLGDSNSSDNPREAVVSISTDRLTPYNEFIQLQDEISEAYFFLRNRYTLEELEKDPKDLTDAELLKVREAYPIIISEALIKL